jgi:HlyD family secretion protein
MKKVLRIVLIAVIIAVFGGTIYYLYDKSKPKPEIVETKTPLITNIVKKTVATGSIIPRKEIDIKPQVSGIIQKLYVEAGQYVKEGDLIAKVKIIPDMINLNNAESRLTMAQIGLEDSKTIYDRQLKLLEKGVIATAEFQTYSVAYQSAKAEVEAAENNLQLIKEGVTKKSEESSNTLIRSTIAGMVLDVPVEEGNSVIETNTFNEGSTIAIIANMGEMVFEGKVDETEVGKIKQGMNLVLSIGAIDDASFNANLEYISPKGVEENGAIQFEIKADVELRKDYFIRAGYSANADIVLEHKDSVMAVSESLLQFSENEDSIYVEVETDPGIFEKRYIKTGLSDGINIEVKEGLGIDDKIKVLK